MRCTVCHRPLTTPAATIQSRAGLMAFGPTCAKAAGLTPLAARRRVQLFSRTTRPGRSRDQLDLFATTEETTE